MEDDPKSGRPSKTKMAENTDKVNQQVRSNCRLTLRMIAEELSLNRESVGTILVQELGIQQVCAKMLPKLLSYNQKEHRATFVETCWKRLGKIWGP